MTRITTRIYAEVKNMTKQPTFERTKRPIGLIDKQIASLSEQEEAQEKRRLKKQNEKQEKEMEIFNDNRPDEVAEGIKGKIQQINFEEWQIQPVVEAIRNKNIRVAVKRLEGFIVLSEKEKKHFLELPPEVVSGWFAGCLSE